MPIQTVAASHGSRRGIGLTGITLETIGTASVWKEHLVFKPALKVEKLSEQQLQA